MPVCGGPSCRGLGSGGPTSKAPIWGSTDLQGADLRDCNLFRTNLEGAQYDERTRFPDHFFPKQAGLIFTSSVSVDGD